uniref:Fibrinogen C-terminal domain-containing protein n=1 Tax=Esox lucius TaxID=8010 RepID=A0AAY5KKI2_ESOLU
IFLLTMRKKSELRVDMEESNYGYTLRLGTYVYEGAGDSLSFHSSMKFTTYDKVQDTAASNCAPTKLGGFWYASCYKTNPNGLYFTQQAMPFPDESLMYILLRENLRYPFTFYFPFRKRRKGRPLQIERFCSSLRTVLERKEKGAVVSSFFQSCTCGA